MIFVRRHRCSVAALALAALSAFTGCGSDSPLGERPADVRSTPRQSRAPQASDAPTAPAMPNLTGLGLQVAQDRAAAAGYRTVSHDATGRSRAQMLDREWQVCFQERLTDRATPTIDLGVVRLREACPATDPAKNAPTIGPDKRLPDFSGRNLAEAIRTLGRNASYVPEDATGEGRNVFVPKNWRICRHEPGGGAVWEGQPVTFHVVKYGEPCPSRGS
ncbi:MAG TPA: hypothetical protein VI076_09375 [Actinopolymorphaceae bacterium]